MLFLRFFISNNHSCFNTKLENFLKTLLENNCGRRKRKTYLLRLSWKTRITITNGMTLRENFMKFLKKNILERENSAEKGGSTILIPTKNTGNGLLKKIWNLQNYF